jgi:hypothetical protein
MLEPFLRSPDNQTLELTGESLLDTKDWRCRKALRNLGVHPQGVLMSAFSSLVLLILVAATAGCSAIITPAATNYPIEAGLDFTQLATMKQGESCSTTVLGIFGPDGNASVAAAATRGGIARVRYVDNRFRNYFLGQRFCVVAYGE